LEQFRLLQTADQDETRQNQTWPGNFRLPNIKYIREQTRSGKPCQFRPNQIIAEKSQLDNTAQARMTNWNWPDRTRQLTRNVCDKTRWSYARQILFAPGGSECTRTIQTALIRSEYTRQVHRRPIKIIIESAILKAIKQADYSRPGRLIQACHTCLI